jgi:hypothetical protein
LTTSEILDNYNRQLEEQDICPKFGGAHDYERLDQQFISKNIVELDLVCLQCGSHKYVYNYLEDSEIGL